MPVGSVLFHAGEEARYVHLMTAGIASMVTTMSGGDGVEVGLISREGFPEHLLLLGPQKSASECFMQVDGTAMRMSFKRFHEEFQRNEALRALILEYTQYEALALAQLAACNRLHEVEDRMARWLLMVQDRMGEPVIRLTQEFLGDMLGTRRSSVTLVAGSLQRAGLIEYTRGSVTILDRAGLEQTTCECYGIMQKRFNALYAGGMAE